MLFLAWPLPPFPEIFLSIPTSSCAARFSAFSTVFFEPIRMALQRVEVATVALPSWSANLDRRITMDPLLPGQVSGLGGEFHYVG